MCGGQGLTRPNDTFKPEMDMADSVLLDLKDHLDLDRDVEG